MSSPVSWRRLDPRMLAVFPLKAIRALLPVLIVVYVSTRDDVQWQLVAAVSGPGLLLAAGLVRWLTVRYRVSADRVEVHSGLLSRQHRSLRRDRVRTVDLTASLVHRIFRLSVLEIGTGSGAGSEGRLTLDAVSRREAERLRSELLDRSTVIPNGPGLGDPSPDGPEGDVLDAPGAVPSELISRLRPSWLRFAPLGTSGLVAVGATLAAAYQFASELGVRLGDLDAVQRAGDRLTEAPVVSAVAGFAAVVLLVGALASLAIYLEGWWGYRLTREADGTLRLRRGLLTTRSLSIEQRRIRGAEVTQSLPLRALRGARVAAVTTGLGVGGSALLPPAPCAEAHRVAAAALHVTDPGQATAAALHRHPAAALRRRLTRALVPTAAALAAAWWAGFPVLWPSLVLLPTAALIAVDRYRNLGHALTPAYLVIGRGSVLRRRVALQRRGIIGWRLSQSVFQRRVGLVTLDAITAAGRGRYPVVDLPIGQAVSLVEQINPEIKPGIDAGIDAGSAPAGAEHPASDLPAQ